MLPLLRLLRIGALLLSVLDGCGPAARQPVVEGTSSWVRLEGGHTLAEARSACDGGTFGQRSDWRLPSIDELRGLIRHCPGTEAGGACRVAGSCAGPECLGDACFGCEFIRGVRRGCYWPDSFGPHCDWVWSGTGVKDRPDFVWYVDYPYGYVLPISADYQMTTLCVRGSD